MPEVSQARMKELHSTKTKFEDTVQADIDAIAVNAGMWVDADINASMSHWLYSQEIEHIDYLKTFRFAAGLNSLNQKTKATTMLEFMGAVVEAAMKDVDHISIRSVFCFAAQDLCRYEGATYESDMAD